MGRRIKGSWSIRVSVYICSPLTTLPGGRYVSRCCETYSQSLAIVEYFFCAVFRRMSNWTSWRPLTFTQTSQLHLVEWH